MLFRIAKRGVCWGPSHGRLVSRGLRKGFVDEVEVGWAGGGGGPSDAGKWVMPPPPPTTKGDIEVLNKESRGTSAVAVEAAASWPLAMAVARSAQPRSKGSSIKLVGSGGNWPADIQGNVGASHRVAIGLDTEAKANGSIESFQVNRWYLTLSISQHSIPGCWLNKDPWYKCVRCHILEFTRRFIAASLRASSNLSLCLLATQLF